MIEVRWYVAVVLALLVLAVLRRTLAVGRLQGYATARQAIITTAKAYADNDPRELEPWEVEIAQTIGAATDWIVAGYVRDTGRSTSTLR